MLITICDKEGKPKVELSPNDSSTQATEIQGDNVLTLSFTHYEHIDLDVDDYADFEGERYWLTEKYRPKQKSTKEWSYDIKLYGVESMIKRLLVIKTIDNEEEPVFTLTAPPREHVAMIVRCMNDGMGNITDWKVGQVDGTENIVIDYFGKYCDQALKEIAEKVGTEWWVEGQTVNICKCEHGEPVFMGYDRGLTGIEPTTADNVDFYTRLYPVGSSRNIDREKYGYSRLQLPGGQKYVEMNADKYGRVDHYEADAFANIYPRRTGVVSNVRNEVKTGEDGKPFTIYYFRDDSLPFNPNDYEIGGLVKRVSFQEGGELAGLGDEEDGTYYFEVNYNSDTREFEIITIWPYDDDTQLPGGTLVPKAGDKYILWNLGMPDEYYALAEEEFLTAVNKYNADHNLDLTVYKASTDHVWIEDNGIDLSIGRRVRLESEEYFPEFGYRDSRITRITRKVNLPSQMDIEIGDALSRTSMQRMSDSVSDAKSYARSIGESTALPDIIRTGDKTRPTDNNLYSAKRTLAEFLSKLKDDRAKGKIASDMGFEIGKYLAGASGGMFGIDKDTGDSFAEVMKLYVRGKAFFETLTIIEANTLAGKQYITPGGSIKCSKVAQKGLVEVIKERPKTDESGNPIVDADGNPVMEEYTEMVDNGVPEGVYRCYFLSEQDGEKTETKIVAGDQAISEMFNAKAGTANKVSNHRYWRLVTGVDNDAYTDESGNHYGYIDLSDTDCEDGSDTPKEGDVIDQLGNRTDKTRQAAMVFSTVEADSPSIKLFSGIDHYSLVDKAVVAFGKDPASGNVFFRLGNSSARHFLEYTQDGGLAVAGRISSLSTLDDEKTLGEVLGDRVKDTDVLYVSHISALPTDAPDLPTLGGDGTIADYKGWSTTAPEWQRDRYIWQCTYVRRGDGTARFAGPTCLSGINGESVTVTATEVRYSTVHNSVTRPADATFTLTDVPALTAGQYLWSRTKVTYSNGDGTVSYGVSRIGTDGADGEGVTIASTSVRYARTTTATQPADSAFTAASIGDLGPIGGGDYIWSRTTVTYSDGTPVSSYGVSRIGSDGDAAVAGLHIAYASGITGSLPHPTAVTGFSVTMFSGARYIGVYTDDKKADSTDFRDYEWALFKGEDGRGIASIEEQYYLSDSQTQLTGGSWKGASEKPTWVPGKYMWTRTKTTLTDGTVIYTDAVCVTGTPGTSVLAEYSADAVSWHPTFTATDVWMRTSDDGGSTWSTAMRIVGSDGADGPWRKFQWAKNTSATTAPTSGWSDTPVTAQPGEYVWMRSGMVVPPATSPATWEAAIRLTGDKGSDGQSVYMLDIDNEVSGIACDASGTVTGSYPTPQASVYKGSTKLTGGITYSIAQKTGITTASITAAGAVTMNGMTADRATVTLQAKVDGVTLTSVISLYKVKAGAAGQAAVVYSIEASADSVTRSMTGALSASSVTCTVYKTTGNSARTATNDHTLTYRRLPDGATGTLGRTGGTSSAVQVLDTTQAIIFELRNASGDLLDRERVPVLSDASDLEIGGRNLLRRSGVPVTTSSYHIATYNTTEALEAGARYTCTLWGELGSGKERFGLYVNGGDNNFMPELKKVGDGVYRATVEAPAMADGRETVSLYHIPSSVTATSTVRKIKLERGTTGTDWTPAPEDVEEEIGSFDYLKAALAQDGAIEGGLALMSHIKVGMNTDASALTQTTYAGLNGLIPDNIAYVGSVIAAWFGGNMEDLFTYNVSTKRYSLISNPSSSKRYAATLFRMDGSLYAAKGNLSVQPDGFTQWGKGSTAVTISPEGVVSLGNGIKIDLSSGAQGLAETMESVLNTQNALTELLEPVDANGEHMSWAEAAKKDSTGAYKAKGLRAKVSLYAERSLAAYYTGGSVTGGGSGGSGGLNESQLAAYLQQHGYLRSADLSGYLTKVAAEATYQPKGNYLTEDQLDHIKVISCYKTTEWNDFRVSGATALTLRAFDVYEAAGAPSTYGNILEIAGRSNHWQPQLWFDSGATGSIRHRNKAYNSNAWGQWHTLLDSNNYPSILDGRYVTRGTAQEITAAKTFKAAVTLDNASLLLKHPSTTGGTARSICFQDYDGTTKFVFGSLLLNHVAQHAYIGWGDSPWEEGTNFAVSADKLRYKGNDILHAGNYAAKLDGRYVTKDSDQTISGSKTFTYGYIKAETLLMFKDKSVSDGIYIAPKPDGGVAFSAHTNYGWTANIGSISHAGDLTMKSFIKTGGTSSQFLKANGSVDDTPYATVASVTALTNSLAAFVKKAGDTMTGVLYLGSTSAQVFANTTYGAWLQYGSDYINIRNGELWKNNANRYWHAGNDGSDSGLDADLLDGWHRDDIRKGVLCFQRFSGTATIGGFDMNTLAPDGGVIYNYGGIGYWANAPQGATYGIALKLSWANTSLGGMLFADINHDSATDVTRSLWWRASGAANGAKAWGKWHQIAFTDGNIASATKLLTARTIWGQSFDGTGNVSGNLTDVGSITSEHYYLSNISTNPYLRLTLNSRNWYVQAFTDKLFVGAGIANSLQIAPDGSVGIGLASSATPAYKLDVNGTARVSSLLTATSGIQIGGTADIGWYIASGTRIAAGAGTARGVNVGSLLVSNAWADHTKVPANGIFSKGTVRVGDGTGAVTGLYSSAVSLHGKGATAGVLLESSGGAAWNTMMYSDGMPRWGYRDSTDGTWNQVLGYLPSDNSFRFTADIGVAAGQRILFRTSKNAVYELYYDETENALVFTGNLVTEKSMAAFRK